MPYTHPSINIEHSILLIPISVTFYPPIIKKCQGRTTKKLAGHKKVSRPPGYGLRRSSGCSSTPWST